MDNKPPHDQRSAKAYKSFLESKWRLRLSEVITKDEMLVRQVKKIQDAIDDIKKTKTHKKLQWSFVTKSL